MSTEARMKGQGEADVRDQVIEKVCRSRAAPARGKRSRLTCSTQIAWEVLTGPDRSWWGGSSETAKPPDC
eukprot:5730512-Pyramimonas_sp.AAC.1